MTLNSGDTVYENDKLIHHAANKGSVPVVVLLSALLQSDEPVAINVNP